MPHVYSHNYKVGEKGAWLGVATNVLLFGVKLAAGIVGRSQAMIADAFHTASDAVTSIAVLVGFKIASKPADTHHPYGHGRAESIAAKLVSIVLIAVGFRIAYDSAHILIQHEMHEPGIIALLVAILSIAVKEMTFRKVIRMGSEINSSSLKADAYHHRSDAFSSVAALIGIAGARMGYRFMDPLAGIIVAGFIIKVGVDVFHQAYDELMDAAPPDELKLKISRIVSDVPGVREVKKIMVRKAGIDFFYEITIGIDSDISVMKGHGITVAIRRKIFSEMPEVKDVIVHAEPCGVTD